MTGRKFNVLVYVLALCCRHFKQTAHAPIEPLTLLIYVYGLGKYLRHFKSIMMIISIVCHRSKTVIRVWLTVGQHLQSNNIRVHEEKREQRQVGHQL